MVLFFSFFPFLGPLNWFTSSSPTSHTPTSRIFLLPSMLLARTSTPSESTYISQFFYGLTHYLSSSSSTKSFSSLSTTMNSQNNEASSPTMKSLSSVVDQSLSSSITSNYICIYSEILLCLLTCIDVTTINPYKNILSLYKNNHKVKKDLHDTNTCLYISFSTLYEHLTSNILFEPKYWVFSLLWFLVWSASICCCYMCLHSAIMWLARTTRRTIWWTFFMFYICILPIVFQKRLSPYCYPSCWFFQRPNPSMQFSSPYLQRSPPGL